MGRNSKWIESQPEDSAELVARRALGARLGRLWHYLERSVLHDSSGDTENVHQLRVFTRRTAAAMEIFANAAAARPSGPSKTLIASSPPKTTPARRAS
jgi:hypothetical protein